MKGCQLKEIHLGDGCPKICLPLVAPTLKELQLAVAAAKNQAVELVEWRMDLFEERQTPAELVEIANWLANEVQDQGVILTYRTQAEGGSGNFPPETYQVLIRTLLERLRDVMVDVEWAANQQNFAELCQLGQHHHVQVLASAHNFERTPTRAENLALLQSMAQAGADVVKLAVMPQSEQDVLELMAVTREAVDSLNVPVITMAMGELGQLSRLSGHLTGAAVTFAAEQQSAPGQLPIHVVRTIWKQLENRE